MLTAGYLFIAIFKCGFELFILLDEIILIYSQFMDNTSSVKIRANIEYFIDRILDGSLSYCMYWFMLKADVAEGWHKTSFSGL